MPAVLFLSHFWHMEKRSRVISSGWREESDRYDVRGRRDTGVTKYRIGLMCLGSERNMTSFQFQERGLLQYRIV